MKAVRKFQLSVIGIACALLFLVSTPTEIRADTIAIVGGLTTVDLNPTTVGALTGAGIAVSPLGSATLIGTTARFPITGGSVDNTTGIALIEHNGSGLALSSTSMTLALENFLINTGTGILSGRATLGTTVLQNVPLLTIDSNLSLFLTPEAAGALTLAFGLPNLTGAPLGVATVQPEPVPEPATLGLLGIGLASLAAARRRRKQHKEL